MMEVFENIAFKRKKAFTPIYFFFFVILSSNLNFEYPF